MCFVRFILAEKKILSLYAALGSKQHSDGNPSHTKHHTNEDATTHCHSHLESNERKTSGTKISKKNMQEECRQCPHRLSSAVE